MSVTQVCWQLPSEPDQDAAPAPDGVSADGRGVSPLHPGELLPRRALPQHRGGLQGGHPQPGS